MTTSIARLPGVIRQACAVSNVPQGQFYPHKPLFPHLSRSELSRAPSRHAAPRTFSDSARRTTAAPKSKDRGPISEEKTTTDFGALNVLGSVPPPTTSIDACLPDGFLFDSGLKVRDGAGCLLVAGEVFSWRPWEKPAMGGTKDQVRGMINEQGQWHVAEEAWAVLAAVWPKPGMFSVNIVVDFRRGRRLSRDINGGS